MQRDYASVSRISKSSRTRLIGGFIMPKKLTGFFPPENNCFSGVQEAFAHSLSRSVMRMGDDIILPTVGRAESQ